MPNPCVVEGCSYPKQRHPVTNTVQRYCQWHRFLRMRIEDQITAAESRLQSALATCTEHVRMIPESEWPTGERWCSGCQSFVPLFYCQGTRCKACASKARRRTSLAAKYGLTEAQHAELDRLQDGRCAICRNHQNMRRLAVDHSHVTGTVRGLLCKDCNNTLLVAVRHSLFIAKNLARYLETPPADGNWIRPEEDL